MDKRAGTGGAADRRRALQPHPRRAVDRRARGYRLLVAVLVLAALLATLAIDGAVLPR